MQVLKQAFGDNEEQVECASWEEGPLMVLAGPGVGKTRVLTHRVGYLLRLYPRDAFKVLALTFTNKAATEMKGRLKEIPGYEKGRVWARTFHGFCTYLLRHYSCYVGINRSFTIIDDTDQLEIIRDVQSAIHLPKVDPKNIRRHISTAKSRMQTPEEYALGLERSEGSIVPAQYYAEYERRLRISDLLDYDDLIWWAIRLFEEIPVTRSIMHNTYRFVLVDECQDTTLAQHKLLGSLIPDECPNLFAVADENQSIFEWNNARIQNLADMIARYDMEVRNLNRSYRCPPAVLRIANKVILKTDTRVVERCRELVAEKPESPDCVSILVCETDVDEAGRILDIIRTGLEAERSLGDFAIIGRTRFAFREIEGALSDANIPYVIVGDSDFLEAPETALYMAALRLLLNPHDGESLRQLVTYLLPDDAAIVYLAIQWSIENRKLLGEAVDHLDEICRHPDRARQIQELYKGLHREDAAQLDAWTALEYVAQVLHSQSVRFGDEFDEGWTQSFDLLRNILQRFRLGVEDQTLPAFMARLSLERRGDILRDAELNVDQVKLLTVHAAKGTEHPVVIIVALEEGLFPHYQSIRESRLDEERRNCFVAMTRTEEQLVLSFAKVRKDSRGNPWKKQPSRFLREVAADVMEK